MFGGNPAITMGSYCNIVFWNNNPVIGLLFSVQRTHALIRCPAVSIRHVGIGSTDLESAGQEIHKSKVWPIHIAV